MTDRRRSERRRPTADALAAADAQRRRFARQLHDETIQTLLSAMQDLEEAKEEIGETPEAATAAVQRSIEVLAASVRLLRERVSDYDPNPPVGLALADAIQLLADQAGRRGGFASAVHVDPGLAGADEAAILSIVRELLANAAKHAGASRVAVNVTSSADGDVRIVVTDDGIGATPKRLDAAFMAGHIGLPLIAARVHEQGGTFGIEGRAAHGTEATIVLPASAG